MNEPLPIDHKDTPGEYRRSVRAGILDRFGGGTPVTDAAQMIGTWEVSFAGFGRGVPPEPAWVHKLLPDGAYVNLTHPGAANDKWMLNPDGTFSVWTLCAANPEMGVAEQLDEDRRHIAALADGRLVAWNGDGSSVLVMSRRRTPRRHPPSGRPSA